MALLEKLRTTTSCYVLGYSDGEVKCNPSVEEYTHLTIVSAVDILFASMLGLKSGGQEMSTFTIEIQEGAEGVFPLVVSSPAGNHNGEFSIPINHDDLGSRLEKNGLKTRKPTDVKPPRTRRSAKPVSDKSVIDLQEIGGQLFEALFQGDTGLAFAGSKGALAADDVLRVVVKPARGISNYAELMSLPWEYLWDKGPEKFIALEPNIVITRFPEARVPFREAVKVTGKLRMLAMASEPKDYPRLGMKKELDKLTEIPDIEVTIMETANIEDLARMAGRGNYHIFHFMGHGGTVPDGGASSLVFEDEDRKGRHVTGEELNIALGNSINLVFLNACDTARIGDDDPFAAISTELAAGGVPAVVAMQFPITDQAAIKLSTEFYKNVANRWAVDLALSDARRMLLLGPEIKTEWGTPVLFMRSPDGVVFDFVDGDAPVDGDQPPN